MLASLAAGLRGTRSTALWGDVNAGGVVDARDALQILLDAANLT